MPVVASLRPEQVSEDHSDDDRHRVGDARETAYGGADVVGDRVAAGAERHRLLEHQEKRDERHQSRDQGDDGLRTEVHFLAAGDVRPWAGPQRKWPMTMPTTTAMTN